MAKNKFTYHGKGITAGVVTPVASPTAATVITTGQTDDSYVSRLVASNESTTATLTLYHHDGTSNFMLTAISVPGHTLSSGNAYDILQTGLIPGSTLDSKGNYIYPLASGHSLRAHGNATINVIFERVDYAE